MTSIRSADRAARRSRRGHFGGALTGFLITAGVALFLLGRIGAATMAMSIPFDPHHALSQLVGLGLLLGGLVRLR